MLCFKATTKESMTLVVPAIQYEYDLSFPVTVSFVNVHEIFNFKHMWPFIKEK